MKKVILLCFLFFAQNLFAQDEPTPILRDYSKQKKKSLRKEKEKIKELANSLKKGKVILEEGEEGEVDHPELALQQEFELTKDPATGAVPVERLETARNVIKQQRIRYRGASPTMANWVERGPNNVGGRTRAIMFDPNDNTYKKVWAGGVGGGLWYTNDITVASPTWVNVSDFWANTGITAIAYNPANTQEFYVGTGEGWGNADAARGAGIWKTTNGGSTWTQLSATSTNNNFDYVQKIVVTSSGTVLAACKSRFCNRGGLFRSTNGGTSFSLVLGTQGTTCGTSNCNAADIEIGADGSIYASLGIFNTGSIHKSTNDGLTWTQLNTGTNGFPNTGLFRIEIATAPSDANRLYAMAQNASNNRLLNIYTSTDQGANWTTCTLPSWVDQSCASPNTDMTRTQSWYDLILAVDPNNPTTVFAGGVDVMKSSNAGSSWTQISSWAGACSRQYMHADQHAIVYRPGSSTVALFGNDGGIFYTANANATIPTVAERNNGYNVTQFYACAIHPTAKTNYFLAGAQDNGTQQFTTSGLNSTDEVTGGDGAYCFIDQTNGNYQISSYVYNNYYLTTNSWSTATTISSSSTTGSFINPADYDDNNHVLFSAYSTTQIQRVLNVTTTPSSPSQITITGMSAMATHLRASPYANAGTSTVFVGTSNSKVYKVINAQGTPTVTDISSASFPSGSSVSCIEIGATENDLVVTFSNYGVTSVWRTTNGGSSWTNIEGNLPDMPVRWALYNPNDRTELFLATELGIWSCSDVTVASPNWISNNNGLSNVRVTMLQIRSSDNMVVASTHGRGLYTTNVFCIAPTITTQPTAPAAVCAGNGVRTLSVVASGSNLVYTWKKNGVVVNNSATISGATTSTLTITNPTLADAGSYTVTVSNNCEDVAISNAVNVTVSSNSSSVSNVSVCNSYVWNGATYNASGTYTFNTTNSSGCDSVATLNLTIKNSSTSITNVTACNSYTWNGTTYNTSGTYTYSTTNSKGCDSVATLNLTIKNSSTSITNVTACNNYTWNGNTYNASGTYTFNTTNSKGCDSVATLNLIINTSSSSTTNVAVCNSYTWNGNTYNTSGTFTFNTTNSKGCDSVATLNLTIKPTYSIFAAVANNGFISNNGTQSICEGNSITYLITPNSGYYITDVVVDGVSVGAVSSYTFNNVTANHTISASFGLSCTPTSSTTNVAICSHTLPYFWNGLTINSAGTFSKILTNAAGCDSIAYLVLSYSRVLPTITGANAVCVNSSITLSNSITGGTWSSIAGRATVNATTGVVTGTVAGTATIVYTFSTGSCAGSVSKNVTVNALPTAPTISYAPGSANPQAGCPAGTFGKNRTFSLLGSPSGGAWSASGQISITSLGVATTSNTNGAASVAYRFTNVNGCSSSRSITGVVGNCAFKGVNTNEVKEFVIYPNPSKGQFNIKVNAQLINKQLVVTDVYGKQVLQQNITALHAMVKCKLPAGTYFATVNNHTEKIVVVE